MFWGCCGRDEFGEDVVYLVNGDAVSGADVVWAWEIGVG